MQNPFIDKKPTFGDIDQIKFLKDEGDIIQRRGEILEKFKSGVIDSKNVYYNEYTTYGASCPFCDAETEEYFDTEEEAFLDLVEKEPVLIEGKKYYVCTECGNLLEK